MNINELAASFIGVVREVTTELDEDDLEEEGAASILRFSINKGKFIRLFVPAHDMSIIIIPNIVSHRPKLSGRISGEHVAKILSPISIVKLNVICKTNTLLKFCLN